jgi:hypothetical protein
MKHCGQVMAQWRARQYNETRHECLICKHLVAVWDNGYTELLREGN